MKTDYSIEVYRELEQEFQRTALYRPMHLERYEPGTERHYEVTGVADENRARVRLVIERFVGGGFAGQVYQVRLLDLQPAGGPVGGLEKDGRYAMKILIPPKGSSTFFRNALYWIGFQGPFQLQVNLNAARSGALWQKFIRRGAKIRFGDERTVADIHATFLDTGLGSCGELSEWIEGRTWRLEVNEHLDRLKDMLRGKAVDGDGLDCPEYRTKYRFMHDFVDLLHDMGAHEFARQYEWSTWKSQPNCLKRTDTEDSPTKGLVAVDFRAGLALLPFLPMSPGDFKLIIQGLARGSLVQFDRGEIAELESFADAQPEAFSDMRPMLGKLRAVDAAYRDSIPDITHNGLRLLSARLWRGILDGAATGWKARNLIDEEHEERLRGSRAMTLLFCLIGWIPLAGRLVLKFWGHKAWRRHYTGILTSRDYLRRAVRGKFVEKVIIWQRAGRLDADHALDAGKRLRPCLYHFPLSILPAGVHRFLTDWAYAKDRLGYLLLRPIRLYFDAALREQWLRDMVEEGERGHLLSDEDAAVILSQVNEPFIQKYLKSLAVHLCTLPVTQVVSVMVAVIYVLLHPEMPRAQAYAIGIGIIALFQVVPISPGSLVRGLYVVFLVIRERNFKDYNIAVFLGFFKYIGYLAFPIQMAYRYPTLARFMAGYWATEAVHTVPVFGERGALLEHKVFNLFYNWPLTIRRRMRRRAEVRSGLSPRSWPIGALALAGALIFGLTDWLYIVNLERLPALKEIWWAVLVVPALCGVASTLGAGGLSLGKRIVGGTLCGALLAGLSIVAAAAVGPGRIMGAGDIVINALWRIFLFGILATVGVLLTEVFLPDPDRK